MFQTRNAATLQCQASTEWHADSPPENVVYQAAIIVVGVHEN